MNIVIDRSRVDLANEFYGDGVELGVADGDFSVIILNNSKVKHLVGIDPYEPHENYKDYTRGTTFNNMKTHAHDKLDDNLRHAFIHKYSMEAVKDFADNILDFVYIDADHSYKTVLEDIFEWTKKVKPGGIVAGDDYMEVNDRKGRYDVVRAVTDYVKAYNIPRLFIYSEANPKQWMFFKP